MPASLADLPAEVLVRLPSGRSFLLYHARSHDPHWETDRRTISTLARTCRKLYKIFNPLLYQTLVPMSLPGPQMGKLIQTVSYQPRLAELVEDVKVDVYDSKFPMTRKELDSSAQESYNLWFQLLSTSFFINTTNLKQLAIRCRGYDELPCNLNELTYAQIVGHHPGSGAGFASRGVEQLFLAPKMEKLILNGPFINGPHTFPVLDSGASNISVLILRMKVISSQTLRSMLRLPQNLSYFEFYSAAMGFSDPDDAEMSRPLTFEDVSTALQPQRQHLGVVVIRYPSPAAGHSSIFGRLTFENFTRLTTLTMSPEMYLGWQQCVHENPRVHETLGPSEPINFANCLPHCLEELTIHLQQYQRARNGNGYAFDVIRGIIQQKKRLYKLESIQLVCCKGVVFCNQCRVTALTYLDQSHTVKRDEIAQIAELCDKSEVLFVWTESDWAPDHSYEMADPRIFIRQAGNTTIRR